MAVLELRLIKTDEIEYAIKNTMISGAIGKSGLSYKSGSYAIRKYMQMQVPPVTVNLPNKLNMPPIPPVNPKAPAFFKNKQKPLIAAVQKLSPVIAI